MMKRPSDIIRDHYHEYASQVLLPPAKQGRVSPSKIASGCLFSVYCDVTEAPYVQEVRDYDNYLTLETGNFLHERLQSFFEWYYTSQGVVYLKEQKVDIAENCYGSIDGLCIDADGSVSIIDYKTCSDNVFSSLGKKANQTYVDQVLLYMHGARADQGSILYVNRSNFKMKEFTVEKDPQRLEELLERIHTVSRSVATRTPPTPTPFWMGTKICTKTCAYRNICPLNTKTSSSKL